MSRPARLAALPLLLASGAALADDPSAQAAAAAASAKDPALDYIGNAFGGNLMFGGFGEDFFATLNLRLNLDYENFGVGLGVPLRLRLIDNDPQNDDDIGGIIRKEDWDEFSDFLRVLRYVYVGNPNKKGLFYGRLGELSGLTVGHGTIVHRYYNGWDANRWRVGTNLAVNVGPFGAEVVAGDIAHPDDPALVGARATLRPLGLFLGEGLWSKFVVGASFMSDPSAPARLERRTADAPDGSYKAGDLVIDEHGHPAIAERDAMFVAGIDVGIELLEGPFTITPYIDFNKITDISEGYGIHIGVLWALRIPVAIDTLTVDLKTEYRRVSGDYLSPYFNTTHEIDRYEFPAGSRSTKLQSLGAGSFEGRNGLYFDVVAGLPEFALISGEFLDYDGGQNDGQLRLGLLVPALEFVRLSAFYYRTSIGGIDDLFKVDERSTIVAKASVPIYYIFTIDAEFKRMWQADPAEAGSYQPVDDWSVGVGFNLEF